MFYNLGFKLPPYHHVILFLYHAAFLPLMAFARSWHVNCSCEHQRKKLGTTDFTDGTDMGNLIHEKISAIRVIRGQQSGKRGG
ncbi:MAG: hypothetical protein HYV36_07420 [Lentisphaerae bacterium]|nr:hypothetical protein [Lentisphaerota bacterium]